MSSSVGSNSSQQILLDLIWPYNGLNEANVYTFDSIHNGCSVDEPICEEYLCPAVLVQQLRMLFLLLKLNFYIIGIWILMSYHAKSFHHVNIYPINRQIIAGVHKDNMFTSIKLRQSGNMIKIAPWFWHDPQQSTSLKIQRWLHHIR